MAEKDNVTGDCVVKRCTKVRVGYRINESFYCQEHYHRRIQTVRFPFSYYDPSVDTVHQPPIDRELHEWKDKPMKCAHDGCDKVGRDSNGPFYCADHYCPIPCSVDACKRMVIGTVNNDPYCDYHMGASSPDKPNVINAVNHPAHYNTGEIEVVDAIMDWGLNFNTGCAVKHTARAGKKDPAKYVEDLEKAVHYLQFEIAWERKHGRG